jgi:hypothetical protein
MTLADHRLTLAWGYRSHSFATRKPASILDGQPPLSLDVAPDATFGYDKSQ